MTRSFGDEMLHAILRLHIDQRWPKSGITDDNIDDVIAEVRRRADARTDHETIMGIAESVIVRFTTLYPLVGKDWVKPYRNPEIQGFSY